MTSSTGTDKELRVFISYRRSDCQAQANGLHDGLVHRLPNANVFMDIDSIPYGVDFEQHIRQEINTCDVVLVLIGDDWLDTTDSQGQRRLDDPGDFVRLEIENALKTPTVRVVPVLVEGASMPRMADLPPSIAHLARLNAIELSDRRWKADLRTLAGVVEELGQAAEEPGPVTVSPTIGLDDINAEAVRSAVQRMPQEFQTKDVSQDSQVVQAHGAVAQAKNYHTMVGRYLLRSAKHLGIESIGKSTNGRGERWQRVTVTAPTANAAASEPHLTARPVPTDDGRSGVLSPPVPQVPAQQGMPTPSAGARRTKVVMVLLPVLSAGLAAWVPAYWASRKHNDVRLRRRLRVRAVGLAAATLLGFILVGTAPVDAQGVATGARSDAGAVLLIVAMIAGTAVAYLHRNAGIDAERRNAQVLHTPWMQQALGGREVRQHHRRLAEQDPRLAQQSYVGRPDLPRNFDDGGLLDLNSLPPDALVTHARLGREEAEAVVVARERFGRLSSVDELVVHAGVDPASAERLREYAIFL